MLDFFPADDIESLIWVESGFAEASIPHIPSLNFRFSKLNIFLHVCSVALALSFGIHFYC